MEAILLSPTPDHQSFPRNKQIRSSKNCNYRGFISRSSENFAPATYIHGGGGGFLSGSPSSLYSSFPSVLGHHQLQQQPPLLPLPMPRIYSSLPVSNNKAILQFPPPSAPNTRKNKNRTRDQDLTPKKSKSSMIHSKHGPRSKTTTKSVVETSTGNSLISSTNRLGPEPRDIPKEVSGVLKFPVVTSSSVAVEGVEDQKEEFSVSAGSIFSLAPPPSSLPLPKFSVTPKFRCNVEAGGVDAGATDNLRRLLRLR